MFEHVGPLDLGGLWARPRPRPTRPARTEPWPPVTQARLSRPPRASPSTSSRRSPTGPILVHHPYDSFVDLGRGVRPRRPSRDPQGPGHQDHPLPHLGRQPHRRARWCGPPSGASRWRPWSSSRPASTRPTTSSGPRCWRRRASTSPTGWSASRPTPRPCWSSARRTTASVATATWAPATTTPRRRRLYEDLGVLSADPDLGADLTQLFNYLTGYGRNVNYRRLMVAPPLAAGRDRRPHPQRDRGRPGPGPDHDEDEQPGRPPDDRPPLRGLRGGGGDRPHHPGHLLPATRGPGPVGEHPGALDRGPLPRALADLLVRPRRRPTTARWSPSAPPTSCPATSTAGSRR